uniref:Nucleolar protein 10 n=1 Tax=Ciona intestinalis TaxID=7719 RepID=F7A8S2_CIOIN
MQVSNPNNIKIYNLSSGKSLPEFITDKKKRSLQKKDVDLRRRIELIQDFGMPTVSTTVKMSPDGQYIFATGTYKPRVRCYDVNHLSVKFERCLDSEAVAFDILSEDYSKLVFLLSNRTIELHTQQGRHYSVRMPKFGRDLCYHPANCDLMLVGAGSEIYRLNLDQGRFLKSYATSSPELNCVTINPEHHLVVVGGVDGRVECWDPRSRQAVGVLDCSTSLQHCVTDDVVPKVTCLKYKGPLNLAVGTSTGQVMLYDIRSNRPYVVKDHRYELPINSIAFNDDNGIVISSDSRAVKLWKENTGEAVTAVEMESDINNMYVVDNSGLFFLANESPKIHSYFIPMLGPAPKWCSFLDNITEEMEENPVQEIYDDYKFLTQKEVQTLGLSNLVGTSLLRAYMHGYFIDIRLYHKAMAVANPFAYKEYRKRKIEERVEEARANRVHVKKLPKVNRHLADRLMTRAADEELKSGKKKKMKREAANLLDDPRFKSMFEDPNFQVDEESEEFKLLNPVVSKQFEKTKAKEEKLAQFPKIQEDSDGDHGSHDESDDFASSDEEDKKWVKEAKKVILLQQSKQKSKSAPQRPLVDKQQQKKMSKPQIFHLKDDVDPGKPFTLQDLDKLGCEEANQKREAKKSATLEERVRESEKKGGISRLVHSDLTSGGKQATFRMNKVTKESVRKDLEKEHRDERRRIRRPASKLKTAKRKNSFFK